MSQKTTNLAPKAQNEPVVLEGPRNLPVLPVRDTVLFPHAVLPLTVGRESSVELINFWGDDKTFTLATVHKVVKMPNQSLFVFAEGLTRVKLGEFSQINPFMKATVTPLTEQED